MAILTINSGSSSLKLGMYADDGAEILLSGSVDGIGQGSGSLSLKARDGHVLESADASPGSQEEALRQLFGRMRTRCDAKVAAVGHRMVHGGPRLREHCALTDAVLQTLEESVHFAPLHIPPAIALVKATEAEFPEARQFACFDTQFHRTLPPEARTYPIPKAYRDAGVERYGFHGLSYASLVRRLGGALRGRTVAAHLGGGSSLCALLEGRSVDTSMGVSPCGGVPMATRSGDLDPGVALLMERTLAPGLPAMSPDKLESTLNHASGMEALAGESDTRVLTMRAGKGDADAVLALAIYTRAIAKCVAGYASVLGGLEMLVFTGGIGEHSAAVRDAVCGRLGFLGVVLDPEAGGPVLSGTASRVEVRVEPADEDGEIAREVARMMGEPRNSGM